MAKTSYEIDWNGLTQVESTKPLHSLPEGNLGEVDITAVLIGASTRVLSGKAWAGRTARVPTIEFFHKTTVESVTYIGVIRIGPNTINKIGHLLAQMGSGVGALPERQGFQVEYKEMVASKISTRNGMELATLRPASATAARLCSGDGYGWNAYLYYGLLECCSKPDTDVKAILSSFRSFLIASKVQMTEGEITTKVKVVPFSFTDDRGQLQRGVTWNTSNASPGASDEDIESWISRNNANQA